MEHHLLELSQALLRLDDKEANTLSIRLAYAWNKLAYLDQARMAVTTLASLRMSPMGSTMPESLEGIGHALEAVDAMSEEAEREFDAAHEAAHQALGHEKE